MELLTPRGRAGVTVLRAAEHERPALYATLSAAASMLATTPGGPPRRAVWRLPDGIVDDVLVVDRGAKGVEVHAHGSPVLLAAVERAFGGLKDPMHEPADALLHRALSREQMLLALEQRQVNFESWIEMVARFPASEREPLVDAAMARSRVASAMARPARVVLAGRQNAGKSTLFNRLVFCERSLAGPRAGLTRDAVTECTALAGYPYEFVDTAGEAENAAGIDAQAIERSRAERRVADLVMLVIDSTREPTDSDLELASSGALVVATKSDLPPARWPVSMKPLVSCAAIDPAAAPSIRIAVGEALRVFRQLPTAGPVGGPAAIDERQAMALSLLASGSVLRPA